MGRALGWLLVGVLAFLGMVTLLAPGAVVLRTLGLSLLALVPAALVALLLRAVLRRRRAHPDETSR